MYEDDDLVFAKNLRIQSKRRKPDWITVLNKKDLEPTDMDDIFNDDESVAL